MDGKNPTLDFVLPGKKKAAKKPKPRGRIKLQAPEAAVLRQKTVTPRGMKQYIAKLMAAYAPHVIPELMEAIRVEINHGNLRNTESILKAFQIIHSPGISVTQNNSNTAIAEAPATHRSFESIIRHSSDPDAGKILDITPEPKQIECSTQSLVSSSQVPDGSEILASRS